MSIIKSGTTTTTAYSVDANTNGDLVFIVSESLTAMSISASGAVSFSSAGGFDIASANITTLTSASATVTNLLATSLTVSSDAFINSVRVGRGAGAVSTNTAIGTSALTSNTSGSVNSALGYESLQANTGGKGNTSVGYGAGYTNTTGDYNTFVGYLSGYASNASGNISNTCIGTFAGYSLTTGSFNTFVGGNAAIGGAGYSITTGSKNTVVGNYTGNLGGLDIRTLSNYIVLSDGDGTPYFYSKSGTGYGSNSPNTYVRGALNWGTSGAEGAFGLHASKVISVDNSGNVTVRAKLQTSISEWQSAYVYVRASTFNADASGGAAAWWLVMMRIYNGGIDGISLRDSGGDTGTLTLTVSDATSGTTDFALLSAGVSGGNNRTTMDAEIVSYNYIIDATRS